MSTVSLATTTRHSKRAREPLGDVTNTQQKSKRSVSSEQQSKRSRSCDRDDQCSTSLARRTVALERWVPETELLKELAISQEEQSLHSARKVMEQMLHANKIPFIGVTKGQAKLPEPFAQRNRQNGQQGPL